MYLFIDHFRFFTSIFLFLFIVVQIILIFRYVNRTNFELAKFLTYLYEEDTSLVFNKDRIEKTFSGLHHSFDKINREIKRLKDENMYKSIFLENLVNNIGTGIISYNQDGDIDIFNEAGKSILGLDDSIKSLDELPDELINFLNKLKAGQQELFELKIKDHVLGSGFVRPIAFASSEFKLYDKTIKLVSFQNIDSELDKKELDAWQRLIKVITHEIANSITSISTITASIKMYLSREGKGRPIETLNQEIIDDALRCATIVDDRSNGLINFINNYKTITRVPEPQLKYFRLKDIFINIESLLNNEFVKSGIDFSYICNPDELQLKADKKLIEQLLINLIKNSVFAVKKSTVKTITLSAELSAEKVVKIMVMDSGEGIPEEIKENIFTPFFTTKEKGSGIGLSISKQIIQMHGGKINVKSDEGDGTVFVLEFPEN